MIDMNVNICNNIQRELKRSGKKQIELANYMGISKQVMSKLLGGSRMISAPELQQISAFLNVSMEKLVALPETVADTNVVRAFMGKVESPAAKAALEKADKLADMICFYANARENAENMMRPWEG